jgi:hypothetical protein
LVYLAGNLFQKADLIFGKRSRPKRQSYGSSHTKATLAGNYPKLNAGDVLAFQEDRGPDTGDPADADPTKRCVVRLIKVDHGLIDPLTTLPITNIEWHAEDALPFALCLA